jgi:hypothetical protein
MTPATTALVTAPALLSTALAGAGLVVRLVVQRADGQPLGPADLTAARASLAALEVRPAATEIRR